MIGLKIEGRDLALDQIGYAQNRWISVSEPGAFYAAAISWMRGGHWAAHNLLPIGIAELPLLSQI